MPDKEQTAEQSFGKYTLINEIKNKYPELFNKDESDNVVSGILYLEGIHFSLIYFPLQHLGYKSVVNSIADLYCNGLLPQKITVNIGVSIRFKKEDIGSILEGMSIACRRYDLKISSLDISSSLTGLAISIASSGKKTEGYIHAKPEETDLICVTGDLGAAFLGVQLLERERKLFEDTDGAQPKLEGFEYVIGRQLKPDLKVNILEKLKEVHVCIGMMRTIRDGLASEIIHISEETGKGCRIYHDRLPIDHDTVTAGSELGFEPVIAALNGGEDFEFVFTAPVNEHEKIEATEGISIIGHLVSPREGNSLVLQDGSLAELKAPGWEGNYEL